MDEKDLNSLEKGQYTNSRSLEQNGTNISDGHLKQFGKTLGENANESGVGNIGADVTLPDSVLEKLYHSYSIKQRRAGLIWFLVASIIFDLWAIIIPQGQSLGAFGITGLVILLNVILCVLLWISKDSRVWEVLWKFAPHIIWLLSVAQLFYYLALKDVVTPRDLLGWGILLNFLVYVTLPVPLVYTGIFFSVGSYAIYLSALVVLAKKDPYFWEQMTANVVLTLAAVIIGLLYYFLGEAKQKRAFLEAKKSLEVKMVIEEQSAEQERLLLSVLPEHVAVKMRQDLGSTNSEQFKKIYMSRHENVSILYADIVGFTAISSTYSAQDLVKMLNELFARFDRLAEKYQQLRIKILGDCYYCISGAPVERPDHAVLCVHMGLSMVKAIKYVQQKANSPVDMRVGIHTGAVLAGILGQRQWQFDVYSKDVELANKMESSGKAGRVHISEKTLSFLNGEFEVEPAYGEKREEALRIAGLKTYFIMKVLKPFVPPDAKQKNGTTLESNTKTGGNSEEVDSNEIIPDEDSKANSDDANAAIDKEKEEDFKRRLQKELVSRDGHGDLSKDTTIFLKFKSEDLEKAFAAHREPFSSVPLVAALLVQIVDIIYSTLILPRLCFHYVIVSTSLLIIAFLVLISVAESFPKSIHPTVVEVSKRYNDTLFLRKYAAIAIILFLGLTNLLDMYYYAITLPKTENTTNLSISSLSSMFVPAENGEEQEDSSFEALPLSSSPSSLSDVLNFNLSYTSTDDHFYPSYMSNYFVLVLIAIAVIAQLSHVCKIFFMTLLTLLHCVINIFVLCEEYVIEDQLVWNIGIPMKYNVSAILFVVALSLSFLTRYMDKEDRVIFKWKTEVAEQKETVSDMRRRNEALVYNVLPVHVAEHFMKNKRRSHDDLYSQSYAEVGVLFASMPNFTDFYSEETVNNQGLECLRFLNEVISDYDALLELPQFQDIIKIKTIGSTYMAASGLNPSRQIKPDDPIIVRWAHLALLVEFALELKKALHGINEQSFNHFVLKMGINHGPITAGVIGARKPHYDIWGNTVNVASRMESTGKAGAIQVTEETCQILQTFGYTFEQRGLVAVKGKGQLMTYYLQGKVTKPNPPSSPMLSTVGAMEPLPEVEEPIDSPKLKEAKLNSNEKGRNTSSSSNSTTMNDENSQNSEQQQHTMNNIKENAKEPNLNINLDKKNCSSTTINSEGDPRSPKDRNSLSFINTIIENSDGSNTVQEQQEQQQNGIENPEMDTDLTDVKTPLLNLNSTNLANRQDYNASEKDSLIIND